MWKCRRRQFPVSVTQFWKPTVNTMAETNKVTDIHIIYDDILSCIFQLRKKNVVTQNTIVYCKISDCSDIAWFFFMFVDLYTVQYFMIEALLRQTTNTSFLYGSSIDWLNNVNCENGFPISSIEVVYLFKT